MLKGGSRRRLLYSTWQLPGNRPHGSTYSLRDELLGQWRLSDFKQDPLEEKRQAFCDLKPALA
eukprot:5039339-Amphidinium_carterae.1